MKMSQTFSMIPCIIALLIVTSVSAVQLRQVYTAGEERYYSASVASYTVDIAGKRSENPLVNATVIYKYAVLSVRADGTVRMSVNPVGAVYNGKSYSTPEQLGVGITISLNKYGKVIAVEVPATAHTPAQTIDLQAYQSKEWRESSWIPDRELKEGDTWSATKEDKNMPKSNGKISITVGAENEMVGDINCCRFDVTGESNVVAEEALALKNPPKMIPGTAVEKCRPYIAGVTGASEVKSTTKCWISTVDGDVIKATGTSRSSLAMNTGAQMLKKQIDIALENVATFQRIGKGDVKVYLADAQNDGVRIAKESYRQHLAGFPFDGIVGHAQNALLSKTYMTVSVGVSLLDIILPEPLAIIDLSIKASTKITPDGRDYSNAELYGGFKLGFGLPILDIFVGAGLNWGNLAEGVKAGATSSNIGLALLFGGMNFSPTTSEIGITTSIINISFGASVSLEDFSGHMLVPGTTIPRIPLEVVIVPNSIKYS